MKRHTATFRHTDERIDRRDPRPPRLAVDRLMRERRRAR
jgi:hypothetical protein